MNPMDATFILDECSNYQHQHHDQNDALFVFREIENPEKAFHFLA